MVYFHLLAGSTEKLQYCSVSTYPFDLITIDNIGFPCGVCNDTVLFDRTLQAVTFDLMLRTRARQWSGLKLSERLSTQSKKKRNKE